MTDPHARNVGVAATALLVSTSTLVCCVLPAVLVSVGAGAALVSLVSAVPQLIWLSEHKAWVFGFAAAALISSGSLLWHARRLPCPIDPELARSCARLRRTSEALYGLGVTIFVVGGVFAFLLPR
jgi:predicted MFS family arabinose efflux permease